VRGHLCIEVERLKQHSQDDCHRRISALSIWNERLRLNQRFHDALANIAANSVLRDIMRSLRESAALLFSPMNSGRGKQNWEEHAAILRAVIDGDAELAALLATRHVYSAAQMQPWT
jgi:DNA-binding GntR family transcriptional regulator